VPAVRRPPVELPVERNAVIVAFAGSPLPDVGEEPTDPVVVVGAAEPDLGGYFMPDEGQVPFSGASIGVNVPSIKDPLRLKYQLI